MTFLKERMEDNILYTQDNAIYKLIENRTAPNTQEDHDTGTY